MKTIHASFSYEDGEYVGLCSDYPSLSYLAKTEKAAMEGIKKLVALIEKDSE